MDIVVGIASMAGREASLAKTLASLEPQVDRIHLWDNTKETRDLADNGKFYGLSKETGSVFYFCCDDDLIYPADYVAKTITAIKHYRSVVTYHGRVLMGMGLDYYRDHKTFHCRRKETELRRIDVAGTGVCAFSTDVFNPTTLWRHPDRFMADVLLSWEAARAGVHIVHLPHDRDWIEYQPQPANTTIAEWEIGKAHRQAALADRILKELLARHPFRV